MKLRIRDDSVRLRLTRGEVESLAREGAFEARTRFGPTTLVYRLELGELVAPRATLEGAEAGTRLIVRLPNDAGRAWAEGDEVGIEATQALDEGELRILVEKDFKCLAPREGEDDGDAFENPQSGHASC